MSAGLSRATLADTDPGTHLPPDGFALISVIWIAGLLAALAIVFVFVVRSQAMLNRVTIDDSLAETVADGLVVLTAFQLATSVDSSAAKALNGQATNCWWSEDIRARIAIQDQGGLIDVNTASPELIAALFGGLGVEPGKASAMVAALQDFRDPDKQSASGGTEPLVYAGRSYGPKDAPLASAEEVDQIPGLDATLFKKLVPLVTVHSLQFGFDAKHAPPALLDRLKIVDPEGYMARRFSSPSPGTVLEIDVLTETAAGSRYRRRALVSLVRQPERPFATLSWRRGGDTPEILPPRNATSPCLN